LIAACFDARQTQADASQDSFLRQSPPRKDSTRDRKRPSAQIPPFFQPQERTMNALTRLNRFDELLADPFHDLLRRFVHGSD
jgi:hypothetical protein